MEFFSDEYIIDLKDYNFNYSDLKITLLINGNAAIELSSDLIQINN